MCLSSLLFPLCKEQKGNCLEMHLRRGQTMVWCVESSGEVMF